MPITEKHIDHYLITRFNIPLTNQIVNTSIDRIDVGTDKDYLDYRFSLFERYTVPSIKKQTNKNFEWIVLFSDQTPDVFRKRIKEIQKEVPNLKPVFLTQGTDPQNLLLNYFKEKKTGTVVTTRIDNDDAFNIRFIEKIQENINWNKKTELLIFPDGIQYDLNKKVMTNYHFPNNHFSTLVCDEKDSIQTVLGYNHMEITRFFDVRYLEVNHPMWWEIVHGGNILNRMFLKFSTLTFDFSILKEFGCTDIPKPASTLKVYLLVLFNKPLNGYHIITNYGVKKTMQKIINRTRRAFIKT